MIIVFSLGSCQEEQVVEVKSEEFSLPVTLEVDGYAHMDSAQVFFFRKFPDRDSLVFRQMVYDLGMQPRQIDFTLPLGVYDVLILSGLLFHGTVYVFFIPANRPYLPSIGEPGV